PRIQRQRDCRGAVHQCHRGAHAIESCPPAPGRQISRPGSDESAMNTIEQPPVEPTNGHGSSDAYEELLRTFFRAEMPDPWPAFVRPQPRILIFPRPQLASGGRFAGMKSRLALAASVVILLVSSWLLSGALRDSKPAPNNGSQPNDTAKPLHLPSVNK